MEAMRNMGTHKSNVSPYCRGEFTVEYLVMITIIIAALIGMGVYLKRGLFGKWREVGDGFGHGKLYEPGQSKKNGTLF